MKTLYRHLCDKLKTSFLLNNVKEVQAIGYTVNSIVSLYHYSTLLLVYLVKIYDLTDLRDLLLVPQRFTNR